MIKLKSLICEAKVQKISLQQALDAKLFGPVYHGTKQENLSKIDQDGFKIVMGLYGTSGMSQGYESSPSYGNTGVPPPIHHLGFGVYFTKSRTIAKKFAGESVRGMKTYFLNIPKYEEINWGSPNTMMKWWIKNGYEPELARRGEGGRYMATAKMTEKLKSEWDAVWYKGHGVYRLLDGDQVCVYEPEGKIFEIDLSLSQGLDAGSAVRAVKDIFWTDREGKVYGDVIPKGTKGIIKSKQLIDPEWKEKFKEFPNHWTLGMDKYIVTVKWKKGGEKQAPDSSIEPLER